MAGLFRRIAQTIFGQRKRRLSIQEQAARDREIRAQKLRERAEQATMTGEQQAEAARRRQVDARRRGDKAGFAQAVADELKAMDFARRQAREQAEQQRRERQARAEKEQAVKNLEKFKAIVREDYLQKRKDIVKNQQPWPFPGPAPKVPEVYKNVNTGNELPDIGAFLIGVKYSAFASSNVVALQYDPRNHDLYIQYKKKGWYRYISVGQAFALHMYYVASKGVAVWDEIRVRGQNARLPSPPASTRKRFQPGVAPPADLPLMSSGGQI